MGMSRDHSAGILLYRWGAASLEVFIGHMGGPFWARKHEGSWSIPKGLVEKGETALDAAVREFGEEVGVPAPAIDYLPLGDFRYSSGKLVTIFAGESDLRVDAVVSHSVTVEFPRGSGRTISFPEIDEVRWVGIDEARSMLVKGQVPALDALTTVA
jgi:predicted NUDIX family NTP pyrophosphohydrolase